MTRVVSLALGLLLLPACMTLDGMVMPSYPVDAYVIESDLIPDDLIEEVSFEAADGTKLYGLWTHQRTAAPPMIFFHGNGGHLASYTERLEAYWLWERYDVFHFDYRGFGKSEGEASFDGVFEQDGLAAVRFVADSTGYAPSEIPWVSLSLGSAVAVHTNDEIDARVVVLESMFASTNDLLDDGTGLDLPTGWFFEDEYDNVEAIRSIRSPVFVIHGLEDDYIDPEYALDAYAAAPDPKELWRPEGVNHSDIIDVIPETYRDRVFAFIDEHPAD